MPKIVYNGMEVANASENYNDMQNKPMINGTELVGNVTFSNLGLEYIAPKAPVEGNWECKLICINGDYSWKYVPYQGE